MDETQTTIKKAIKFFRLYHDKCDKELYRRQVLTFCDYLEKAYIQAPAVDPTEENVKEALF